MRGEGEGEVKLTREAAAGFTLLFAFLLCLFMCALASEEELLNEIPSIAGKIEKQ